MYEVQCNFLTGGWMTHWHSAKFNDLEEAMQRADQLAKYYLLTRVIEGPPKGIPAFRVGEKVAEETVVYEAFGSI